MINAERMLGSLVREAIGGGRRRGRRRRRRRRGLGGLATGAIGLGALGVAFAAFEHFSQKQGAGGSSQASSTPPSPPGSGTPLPPLPNTGSSAPPLPPLPVTKAAAEEDSSAEALLLIRAMIAAANADYEIDDEERARIEGALEEADLSSEERDFLRAEMETPWDLARVADAASTPDLAREIYLASLMAIEVDSAAEENYLARLAERMGLDEAAVGAIEDLIEPG